jgi:hypothetical protein
MSDSKYPIASMGGFTVTTTAADTAYQVTGSEFMVHEATFTCGTAQGEFYVGDLNVSSTNFYIFGEGPEAVGDASTAPSVPVKIGPFPNGAMFDLSDVRTGG